ncbi:hypothetical protein LSH36_1040g00015 [Paralvinella palmiformis]|uniref:Fucosyltransferase n=1 Tax=Paralvinella palmiformis TaxID=53620 RepID=A0AAD9MSW2_9ANNE|nr:hypothetical protein LSH36_1040g00015 [Paralvinella palmiformis]
MAMWWRRMTSFRTLSAITGYIGVIHLVMTLFKNEDTNRYHLDVITCRPANFQIVSVESKNVSEEKIILLWTAFYRDLYFGLGKFGREPFIERRCEARNCFLTNDRSMLDKASAVVIHNRHHWRQSADRTIFGNRSNANQLFVYVSMESPGYTYLSRALPESCQMMFNVTMTYRLDSDVPIPYGYVAKRSANKSRDDYDVRNESAIERGRLANKTRSVAWLVSHSDTISRRETYVRVMSRFIDIDVYGKRGNQTCKHWRTDRCMAMIAQTYKFYLSFENSICRDYVTEKYYRTLNYDLIPIVYGGANYVALGPPGSYLDVYDFRSPRALARYLRYLAANQSAYLEYFRWKFDYEVVYFDSTAAAVANGFCRLCYLVNTDYRKTYDNICEWWHNGTCGQTIFDTI